MQITIYPKSNSNYLVRFDQVLTVVSERTMAYLLSDELYSDQEGWSCIQDKDVIMLPNDVVVLISNKLLFIEHLGKAVSSIPGMQEQYSFND